MKRRITAIAATAAAALSSLTVALSAPTAQADTVGHVILKAAGGTIALATTGVVGSRVYAGRYRASNHAEDFNRDSEPGGSFPGGRFGFFWAPGGVQTNKYVQDGGATSAVLVNGASHATIFTAVPEGGGYAALVYLAGGTERTSFVLSYDGGGLVTLKGAGSPLKPTADELWKISG